LSPPSPEPTIAAPFAFFVVIPEGNQRLPPANFPKREIPKNKAQKVDIFLAARNHHAKHHKNHAIHHALTTISPPQNTRKSQNRQQKSPCRSRKKIPNTTAALTFFAIKAD